MLLQSKELRARARRQAGGFCNSIEKPYIYCTEDDGAITMKRIIQYLLTASLLLGGCIAARGQAKVYTKGFLLEDFPSAIVKVIPTGNVLFDLDFKTAITECWTISPWEMCDVDDFTRARTEPDSYVLSIVSSGGLVFLSLDKGGKEDDANKRRRPFNVAALPLATLENFGMGEYSRLPVWLDILQDYVSAAIENEKIAYAGLKYRNNQKLPEQYSVATFTPTKPSKGDFSYTLWYDEESHELYRYEKHRFNGREFK